MKINVFNSKVLILVLSCFLLICGINGAGNKNQNKQDFKISTIIPLKIKDQI